MTNDNRPTIYVIVGNSHAGKTSFTRNTFFRGREGILKKDIMYYTEFPDCYVLGRYNCGTRCKEGTGVLERKQVGNFAKQILALYKDRDIVIEGMRAVSRPMMNALIEAGCRLKLIWMKISPEVCMERTRKWGTEILTLAGAITQYNKTSNFIRDFTGKLPIDIIDTEEVKDFAKFSMTNLCGAKIEHLPEGDMK